MLRLTFVTVLGLALSQGACTATLKSFTRGKANTVEELYAQSLEDLADGLYPEALSGFTEVKTRYPYSKYAALADLRLADTHFARGKFLEAVDAYRTFLKYHPNHTEVPYAMLRIGESYFEQIPSDWWFLPPAAEKDQANTNLAISAYRDLIARYPQSPQSDEARKRMDECRRKLADHEMYVARFYFSRERFRAAANRADGVLRQYGSLGLDPEALWIVGRSRAELKELDAAAEALEELTTRFPDSKQADEAAALLRDVRARRPAKPAAQAETQGS